MKHFFPYPYPPDLIIINTPATCLWTHPNYLALATNFSNLDCVYQV